MISPIFDAKAFLHSVTTSPGVYQMYSQADEVIYVGKAKNLKKRLSSYFQKQHTDRKTESLVKHIHHIQVTVTSSETEALLLENTLIKKYKPKYNILFRDDKSYPYLYLSAHTFPRMQILRGKQSLPGYYFGPLASAHSARQSLYLLQKLFKIRDCRDSFYSNRSRPCLQYQIDRCTAPCVNYVSAEDYAKQVQHAKSFLQGKNQSVLDAWVKAMEEAAKARQFEEAAKLRDKIALLRQAQEQQYMLTTRGEVDVIGYASSHGVHVLSLLQIRAGNVFDHKIYRPNVQDDDDMSDVIAAFLTQHYLALEPHLWPTTIVLPLAWPELSWLQSSLNSVAKRNVHMVTKPKTIQRQWLQLAMQNAKEAVTQYLQDKLTMKQRLASLAEVLTISHEIKHIECFDISHYQGEGTVASCVVMGEQGMEPNAYRRFTIKTAQNDDYQSMREAITRRYQRLVKEDAILPDLILIDGGKGQWKVAHEVLTLLELTIPIVGIAKGVTRKPGFEELWLSEKHSIQLASDSMALHVLQQIRDEAHRFAITAQRKKLRKPRSHSSLDDIPGIGPKRRRALLARFGSVSELAKVSVEELAKVPGISLSLAKTLYETLR